MVEAGLGGRHDATNVLAAPVAVLTNVGLEHTRWLGPTLTDIAREKLAVVAPGSTLVVGPLEPEVEAEVAKVDARVLRADPADGAPLQGFQRTNFAVARTAAAALHGELDDAAVLRAASAITVPGRFEVMSEAPLTIYDGAHNPSGIAALASALREVVGHRRLIGVLLRPRRQGRGRDAARARRPLLRRGLHRRRRTRARSRRRRSRRCGASSPGPPAEIEAQPHAAVRMAQELAGEDGAVVATGSIYLVADLLAAPGTRRRSAL